MPTATEIQTERERLYDSAALREDINDDEATVLLEWGEKHVVRLGEAAADSADLEQRARFLRQLIKNINRFVGQRQYNDRAGQIGYMEKVVKWLENPLLGFKNFTASELLDKLPPDAKDMASTLRALLDAIDPGRTGNTGPQGSPNVPSQDRPKPVQSGSPFSAQSVQGEGQPPDRPTSIRDAASQAAHQMDPHARPDLPKPDDGHPSGTYQRPDSLLEKSDTSPQSEGRTDAPSLLDALRQAITGRVEEKHPDSKRNEALESLRQSVQETHDDEDKKSAKIDMLEALRQSVDKTQDDDETGEHRSNRSPHENQPADHQRSRHDQSVNQPRTREEDEDNGKTAK